MAADFRRQIGGMLAVGAAGFFVDAVVLSIFVHRFFWPPIAARLVSFLVAATFTWQLNKRFTFRAMPTPGSARYVRYLLASGGGFGVNFAVFSAAVLYVQHLRAWPIFALALASAAGLLVNFVLYRHWVFRSRVLP